MKQIAVVGASQCNEEIYSIAEKIGELIAEKGWILINGGLGGVMEASARGARKKGGVVVGIIPHSDKTYANPYCSIIIATNMGHARNMVIVHSSDAIIAVDGEYGTISEIAIALKEKKPVVVINPPVRLKDMIIVESPEEAIKMLEDSLGSS
jgi:hypothetical protein